MVIPICRPFVHFTILILRVLVADPNFIQQVLAAAMDQDAAESFAVFDKLPRAFDAFDASAAGCRFPGGHPGFRVDAWPPETGTMKRALGGSRSSLRLLQ